MVKHYLQLARWKNLLIVGTVQLVIYFILLLPGIHVAGSSPTLTCFQAFLLLVSTLCVAASGYIINDIYDSGIDQINRPESTFIPQLITFPAARNFYLGIVLLGASIALYLAICIDRELLFILYPVAVGLLWLYSARLKGTILSGNILVSLFCSGVILLPLLGESNADIDPTYLEAVYFYAAFAGLATFFREVVKDMEDVEGDSQENARTLAVVYGIRTSKTVAIAAGILLMLVLIYWMFRLLEEEYYVLGAGIILLFVWQFRLTILVLGSMGTIQFHHISQMTKYLMLAGTALLFFL